jgi:hypothetical protein
MPKDDESGLVEPDITINGYPLTFAECMSVRVAIGSYRMLLSSPEVRKQLGNLAVNYEFHLANVERVFLNQRR